MPSLEYTQSFGHYERGLQVHHLNNDTQCALWLSQPPKHSQCTHHDSWDVLPNTLIFFTDKRSPKYTTSRITHTTIHTYDAKEAAATNRAQASLVHDHPQWIDGEAWVSTGSKTMAAHFLRTLCKRDTLFGYNRHRTKNFCVHVFATDIEWKLSRDGHQRVEWKNQAGTWSMNRLYPSTTLLVQVWQSSSSFSYLLHFWTEERYTGLRTCMADAVATPLVL